MAHKEIVVGTHSSVCENTDIVEKIFLMLAGDLSTEKNRVNTDIVEKIFLMLAGDLSTEKNRVEALLDVLKNLPLVCKTWLLVYRNPTFWRKLSQQVWGGGIYDDLERNKGFAKEKRLLRIAKARFGLSCVRFLNFQPGSPFKISNSLHRKLSLGKRCTSVCIHGSYILCGYSDGWVDIYDNDSQIIMKKTCSISTGEGITSIIVVYNSNTETDQVIFSCGNGDIYAMDFFNDRQPDMIYKGSVDDQEYLIDFDGNNNCWIGLYGDSDGGFFFRVWRNTDKRRDNIFKVENLIHSTPFMRNINIGRVGIKGTLVIACTQYEIISFDIEEIFSKKDDKDLPLPVFSYTSSSYPNGKYFVDTFGCSHQTFSVVVRTEPAEKRSLTFGIVCQTKNLEIIHRFSVNPPTYGDESFFQGSQNNDFFALASSGNEICIYRLDNGYKVSSNDVAAAAHTHISILEVHDRFVVAISDKVMHVWDYNMGKIMVRDDDAKEERINLLDELKE